MSEVTDTEPPPRARRDPYRTVTQRCPVHGVRHRPTFRYSPSRISNARALNVYREESDRPQMVPYHHRANSNINTTIRSSTLPAEAYGPHFPGENARPERPSSEGHDAVWNPSSQHYMAVRLEVEIEEDIEDNIADVACMKRMGSFRDADEYFRECLSDYFQDPRVVLEYADILLAQGDFGHIFESFDDEEITREVFSKPSYTDMSLEEQAASGLQINLLLILHLARSYSDPDMDAALEAARFAYKYLQARLSGSQSVLDPTELQILCRYLTLISYIHENSNLVTEADFSMRNGWQQWAGLYRTLLEEGRHWDVRDIVVAFVKAFGPLQACNNLLGEDSLATEISRLVRDWEMLAGDETDGLCLLDTLVCFCRAIVEMLEADGSLAGLADFLFKQARAVASSIKRTDLESIKYRPFLEWILAEEEHIRILGSLRGRAQADVQAVAPRFFNVLPGWTIWSGVLPIYAPSASEAPGWPVSSEPNKPLGVVLEAAEELGDLSTQVSCLQELICQSREPRDLFARLDHLQFSVMGDRLGALKTRLSKYLLAVDDGSRRSLTKELIALNPETPIWRNFGHPMVEWCQRRVLHALLLSTECDLEKPQVVDGQATTLHQDLPPNFLSDGDKAGRYRSFPIAPRPVAPRRHTTTSASGPSAASSSSSNLSYDDKLQAEGRRKRGHDTGKKVQVVREDANPGPNETHRSARVPSRRVSHHAQSPPGFGRDRDIRTYSGHPPPPLPRSFPPPPLKDTLGSVPRPGELERLKERMALLELKMERKELREKISRGAERGEYTSEPEQMPEEGQTRRRRR